MDSSIPAARTSLEDAGSHKPPTYHKTMLSWTLTFIVVALIAGVLGFTGIAGAAAGVAKICFFIFLILFLVSLIRGGGPKAV